MLTRRDFLAMTAITGVTGLASCRSPLPKNLATYDATAQAELVAKRRASPLELVEAAIARIQKVNPQLNFLAADNFEKARERAKKKTKPTGPFAGVPYLLKDLVEYPDLAYRRGSRMFASRRGSRKPPLVERQEAAGLIMLGKSTTPEFGLTASTESSIAGATRNPWDPGLTPGGSSGGSAAAVASGAVPIAHASDGGGSIRIPASCCALFGLKPSRDRIASAQDEEQGLVISVNHCLTRSVRDSARMLSVTERVDGPLQPVGFVAGPDKDTKLTIAYSNKRLDGEDASKDARAANKAAIEVCKDLGHEVIERDYPIEGRAFTDAFILFWAAGAFDVATQYQRLTGRPPDASVLEPWTLGLAAYYQMQPPDALDKALTYFQAVISQIDSFFKEVDVMLTPTVDSAPPPVGFLDPKMPFMTHLQRILTFVAYTPIHNIAGTPAMSVPLYWTKEGLPLGSQFAARKGREDMLLSLAYQLEKEKPWAKKKPPVFA